jgi:TRAP-type C4-dicarboxylate transport system substrate-binding protein
MVAGCTEGNGGDGTPTDPEGNNGTPGDESTQTIGSQTWKAADFLPEGDINRESQILSWGPKVNSRTDGNVSFEYYPGGQLGGGGEMLNLVQSEAADIVCIVPGYVIDQMPLSYVPTVPGIVATSDQITRAYWNLFKNELAELELNDLGLKPIAGAASPQFNIMTRAEIGRIESMDDMEDLTIGCPGGIPALAVDALGASSVTMTGTERYSAMQQGTIDGNLVVNSSAITYSYNEVGQHFTTNLKLGSSPIWYHLDKKIYDSSSDRLQTIIDETSNEVVPNAGDTLYQQKLDVEEQLADNGKDVYEVENVDDWNEQLQSVQDKWVSQGSDTRQVVLDAYLNYLAEVQE